MRATTTSPSTAEFSTICRVGAFKRPLKHLHASLLVAFALRLFLRYSFDASQWLKVGITEDGRVTRSERGTPQGAVDGSPNAKDNFRFERTILGWRGRCLLDLRRKR